VTVGKVADFTIALGPGGHIVGQGNTNTVLTSSLETKNEAEMQKRSRKSSLDRGSTTRQPSAIDKPASVEEVAGGHVGWSALKLFFLALGNVRFWIIYIAGFVLANVVVLIQTYWLGCVKVSPSWPKLTRSRTGPGLERTTLTQRTQNE
jgi:hypothetical protein